jgi:DNA-binding transcriptional ArsR family regulator
MSEVRYKDLGTTILRELFGDSPKIRILDIFFDNPYFDFSKSEVIRELGLSKTTFYKHFPYLEENGLVTVSRRFGKTKLYRINRENPVVDKLEDIVMTVSLKTAEQEAEKMKRPIAAR